MTEDFSLERDILQYNPKDDGQYRTAAETFMLAPAKRPDPIPWPDSLAPTWVRPPTQVPDTDPLPEADVLIVTYTVAEGQALADVFTPGHPSLAYTSYRNNWDHFRTLVRKGAPSQMRQRAGAWAVSQIGTQSVVVFKSELHPAIDGPYLPIVDLWRQIIAQVKPKLVLTTGTAGGIGADTILGDVVISPVVRWDCNKWFSHSPFAHEAYTSPGGMGLLSKPLVPSLLNKVENQLWTANDLQLPAASRNPQTWVGTSVKPIEVVSTDFFAFDTADDHYGLRAYAPNARAVEMDDAALGLALKQLDLQPAWLSVRNASDPQMTGSDLHTEAKEAAKIYQRYGYWTTINSAIACWALVTAL